MGKATEQYAQKHLTWQADPLQAVSNVIELKPDHKYLLIFHDATRRQLDEVTTRLRLMGIENLTISIPDRQDVEIVEVSTEREERAS